MYTVDLYLRVRLACHVDGVSEREAASRFGIARETVRKMLRHAEPPGYRRRQPPKRPKLGPFTDIIDRILEEDRTVHRKQHHTAKRIFERLRDEHGFTGKQTIVKDYVRERRRRLGEIFVPLAQRAQQNLCLFRRCSPIDSLRQRQVPGVAHLAGWHATTNASVQRTAVPLPLRGPLRPSRQGQRQRQC